MTRVAQRRIQTAAGEFELRVYRDEPTGQPHLALVCGTPTADRETLVRVHEPLSPIDLLITGGTEHSWSVGRALSALAAHGEGVLVMLNCAQPADLLLSQVQSWCAGAAPTAGADRSPRGESMDLRTYGIGAQILRDIGVGRMRLLAAPRRMPSMAGFNLEVTGFVGDEERTK